MSSADYLKMYIPMVEFLSAVCGPNCEVVLHDVTTPDYSIVAIKNPLTCNYIGCPLSGLSLDFGDVEKIRNQKYLVNYIETISDKRYLSSAYFIFREEALIGVLSINKDLTPIEECRLAVNGLLSQYNLAMPTDPIEDSDKSPVMALLDTMISDAIQDVGLAPSRMSMREKIALVHKLSGNGVLMINGAIPEIASRLGISEPTVYRYLNRRVK